MYWSPFFHLYQPPDQNLDILNRIVNESYRPLVKGWLANPSAKATLNISGCLTELLIKNHYGDVISGIKTLLDRGQIELTASAKYHPFLPILPGKEIIRQIQLNEETNRRAFGKSYRPLGFFPPEMGYGREAGSVIWKMGYKWIILDEIAYNGKIEQVKNDRLYQLKTQNSNAKSTSAATLYIFFRNRRMSNLIMSAMLRSVDSFSEAVGRDINENKYLITAMDAETFGHHRPGLDRVLFNFYKNSAAKIVTVSGLLTLFKDRYEEVDPISCTWASSEKEIEEGKNFYLYYNPKNKLHRLQKKLIDIAIKVVDTGSASRGSWKFSAKSRLLLDRALSCNHMWWSNPDAWWSIEEIEKGAYALKKAVQAAGGGRGGHPSSARTLHRLVQGRTSDGGRGRQDLLQSEKAEFLYRQIMDTAFSCQRSGLVARLHAEKETFKKIPFKERAKPGEYEAILEILKEEEGKAVERGEYELAIRWRDSARKLEHGLDIYDFVHIVDQMRFENKLGRYEELAKKYKGQYNKLAPGQPDK